MLPLHYDNAKTRPPTHDGLHARICTTLARLGHTLGHLRVRQVLILVLLVAACVVVVVSLVPSVRDNERVQSFKNALVVPWQPSSSQRAIAASVVAIETGVAKGTNRPPVLGALTNSEGSAGADVLAQKRAAVVQAIKFAWDAYKEHAWGFDELRPIAKEGETWFNLGLTITDSLDTLWLAGMTDEFNDARAWVANSLSFERNNPVNLFEVTIRVLGGLLAAHHLSNDEIFLQRAQDLGDRLCGAFTQSSAIPVASVELGTHKAVLAHFNGGSSSTSEVATIQLEFAYLSKLTGNSKYRRLAEKVIAQIETLPSEDGLVPVYINPHNGQFSGSEIKLGARGDSYYEYLLKQWIQSRDERAYRMYRKAVGGIQKHLVGYSHPNRLVFIGEKFIGSNNLSPKMDHLVCFLPGVLALGVTEGKLISEMDGPLTAQQESEMKLAEDLLYTCYQMYNSTATGLAPEIAYFNTRAPGTSDIIIHAADTHNLLRPETVESLFILWRITHNRKYRDWGWEIFQAFEKHSRVPSGGYTDLRDVTKIPPPPMDKMESFFLAETLKYLLLLFSDDTVMPLTSYVFNTEAHPLPIFATL